MTDATRTLTRSRSIPPFARDSRAERSIPLTFCGAIDTQRILPTGTPEEVGAEVRRVIEILGRGGGYMVSSVHTVMNDVPAENILAMVDAVEER